MKIFGYILTGIASATLSSLGYDICTWQWWLITTCFILGEYFVCNGNKVNS